MFLGNVYVLDERQRKRRKETIANGGQSEEKEVLAEPPVTVSQGRALFLRNKGHD